MANSKYFSDGAHKEFVLSILEGIPTHRSMNRDKTHLSINAMELLKQKKEFHKALQVFLSLSPQETIRRLSYGLRFLPSRNITVNASKGWYDTVERAGFASTANYARKHTYTFPGCNGIHLTPMYLPIKRRKQNREIEVVLAKFAAPPQSWDEALTLPTEYGWKHACFEELLAFTAQAEEGFLSERLIVAAGQSSAAWRSGPHFPTSKKGYGSNDIVLEPSNEHNLMRLSPNWYFLLYRNA